MPSQWSSTDRVRRWVFLAAMGVVGLLLAYVAYGILHGRPAAAPAPSPTTRPPRPASPRATDSPVPVPSGHEQDDSQAEPSPRRSQGPLRVPPRYDTAPALPLTEADLTAARDRALTFLEVFANGRWDDRPDDKITKLRQFVPPASIDVVLAAYDRTRAKADRHELVTYRVTEARWRLLAERQVALHVVGDRAVSDDGGDRTDRRGFVVSLVRESDGWQVTAVRDPSEGDAGFG